MKKHTEYLWREAVSFVIDVCNKEWNNVSSYNGKQKKTFVESLIHSTNNHNAKYDFDNKFYKFPSYLRRDVIASAIGIVSSYKSNYKNWSIDKTGKAPTLSYDHKDMPVFYRKNMYLESDNKYECKIKVFLNNDWVWKTVKFKKTDVDYFTKHLNELEPSAPTLEKRFGKYYLRFAFSQNVELTESNDLICSVDLGINTDATCTIMRKDGTILGRKFINFKSDKDQLQHLCNRIRKKQRKYGPKNVKGLWRYATYLNKELSVKIATAIVDFAINHNVDVIVFEHLDMKCKISGKNKQKLHLWRKNGIQELTTYKAHCHNMRISRICAWGTSKFAYDGSGEVKRDKNNHSIATFQSGKVYNCDLSASYNIGARYFIRELLKPVTATERSVILAKVPVLQRRTSCTYDTLRRLNSALAELTS